MWKFENNIQKYSYLNLQIASSFQMCCQSILYVLFSDVKNWLYLILKGFYLLKKIFRIIRVF